MNKNDMMKLFPVGTFVAVRTTHMNGLSYGVITEYLEETFVLDYQDGKGSDAMNIEDCHNVCKGPLAEAMWMTSGQSRSDKMARALDVAVQHQANRDRVERGEEPVPVASYDEIAKEDDDDGIPLPPGHPLRSLFGG